MFSSLTMSVLPLGKIHQKLPKRDAKLIKKITKEECKTHQKLSKRGANLIKDYQRGVQNSSKMTKEGWKTH